MSHEHVLYSVEASTDCEDYIAPAGAYFVDALVDVAAQFIQAHPREFRLFISVGLILMGACVGADALQHAEVTGLRDENDLADNTAFEETEP